MDMKMKDMAVQNQPVLIYGKMSTDVAPFLKVLTIPDGGYG